MRVFAQVEITERYKNKNKKIFRKELMPKRSDCYKPTILGQQIKLLVGKELETFLIDNVSPWSELEPLKPTIIYLKPKVLTSRFIQEFEQDNQWEEIKA